MRSEEQPSEIEIETEAEAKPERRVFRVNHHHKRKPMTLDEAVLEMEKDRTYLVYRDAKADHFRCFSGAATGRFEGWRGSGG